MYTPKKLKIFLADLTHTGIRIANEAFPLNVGLLASYAMKRFGSSIEVRLFKYPEKLLEALADGGCDLLAGSSYVWNNNLTEWAFETAKTINPSVLTVRGGPNFPLEDCQQLAYLQKHRYTDIYCYHEGEIPFSNILERILSTNTRPVCNDTAIGGCVFLSSDGTTLIKGTPADRITTLDDIPSPYTTGLLDEFFDGKLTPILATTRGCPFTCNYCNASEPIYNKVNFFSADYVRDEIFYIAKRISAYGISNLTFADNNFGMYKRDKHIADALAETQQLYKWPLSIIACTGKNNVDEILSSTETLGDALTISMSVQSMDTNTLRIIERDNIKMQMYTDIAQRMEEKGRARIAELIVPLPLETFTGYMDGIKKLIGIGANSIISYTLALSKGTVYTGNDFKSRYGYEGKFRLIPNDFGTYGGKRIFDYEEVATFSNSFTFDEYLEIRKLALVTELLFNNSIFSELARLLQENRSNIFELLKSTLDHLAEAPESVRAVFESFTSETTGELKDTEEQLIEFYSDDNNYRKALEGLAGGNIIYKHKGLIMVATMSDWIGYVTQCASRLVSQNQPGACHPECDPRVDAVMSFIAAKLHGLFEPEMTDKEIVKTIPYNVLAWLDTPEGPNISAYAEDTTFRFYYDAGQILERNDLFSRYSTDISGLSKIMARLMSLDRIFRKVEPITS